MRSALLLGLLAVLTSGCATLVRGSTDQVLVDADRDSAFVFVDGVPAGVTPAQIEVRRSRSHHIEVVRDSFLIAQTEVTQSFNPTAAAGSFFVGGPASLAVDVGTGAVFDLDPDVVWVSLVPDSTGADADLVAGLVRQARQAALGGFADADPFRRRAPPWVTVQLATGVYLGGDPSGDRDASTGGLGASLLAGVRDQGFSARLSATASSGFLFDNSERWEVAALVGVVTETPGGRLRLGFSAGPGLAGGRDSNACFFCGGVERPRNALPTRVGLSMLGEAHVYLTPQLGVGIQVPANLRLGDSLGGVLIGWKYEGL